MDGTRLRRTRDPARQRYYAANRAKRFSRLGSKEKNSTR